MPDSMIPVLLANYADTQKWILDAVESIPAEDFARQYPGVPNHPAWTLCHLSAAAAFLGQLLGAEFGATAEEENKLHGPGTKPVADSGAYPSKAELLGQFAERHRLVEAAAGSSLASRFAEPSPEFLRSVAPTVGNIALYLLASHEHYHLAQINEFRRAGGFR